MNEQRTEDKYLEELRTLLGGCPGAPYLVIRLPIPTEYYTEMEGGGVELVMPSSVVRLVAQSMLRMCEEKERHAPAKR